MSVQLFDNDNVRLLLEAVGLGSAVSAADYDRSFDELELDSLARIEIATRIHDSYGIDVEDELTAEQTPAGMKTLVNAQLAA